MASFALTKLVNRKLIKITGPDCYPYLQSLFCNDLRYLYEPDRIPPKEHANVSPSVISAFMLNAHGKAICDTLIYRTSNTRYQCDFTPPGEAKEPDELLIECDASLASGLANTLYGYRVRRKVSLEIVKNQSIWCLHPKININPISESLIDKLSENVVTQNQPHALTSMREIISHDLTLVSDPRLRMLGLRILQYDDETLVNNERSEFDKLKNLINSHIDVDIQQGTVKDYILHRYRLGVGEGPNDHPESSCFPLECNADLLNSVSFNKGCYLGQELTARIHFTGVVRKRLMPICLDTETRQNNSVPYARDTEILEEESGKKLGILRHIVSGYGLGLLRSDLINDNTKLIHEGTRTKISTWKPYWWQHSHEIEKETT